jgi:hypothetical protein
MQLPEPLEHFHFHEAGHGHEHDGGEHGLRQIAQQVGEKERDDEMMPAAIKPESGVRAPPLSLTSDCDMPPLIGKPWPSPTRDSPGEREEFLVAVEPVAVLLGEHPPDRRRLDRAEEESTPAPAASVRASRLMHRGQRRQRQAARHFAEQLHAVRAEIDERSPRRFRRSRRRARPVCSAAASFRE